MKPNSNVEFEDPIGLGARDDCVKADLCTSAISRQHLRLHCDVQFNIRHQEGITVAHKFSDNLPCKCFAQWLILVVSFEQLQTLKECAF